MPTPPSTAVLFFSRSAEREAAAKAFGGRHGNRLRLASGLIRRTEGVLARSGLPILRSDETRQGAGTFGRRIAKAVAEGFNSGHTGLIVIGNDAPGLTVTHLRRAQKALDEGAELLIPDHRGGVALLALRADRFDGLAFEALPWETEDLWAALTCLVKDARVLSGLADVNSLADLRRLWHWVKTSLRDLADLLFRPVFLEHTFVLSSVRATGRPAGRAPPMG